MPDKENGHRLKRVIWVFAPCLLLLLYLVYFYPKEAEGQVSYLDVQTPDDSLYHNDCLHPCIRIDSVRNGYWMVQSPYYRSNSRIENPILYFSEDYHIWDNGVIVEGTPEYGYNSDPNILISKDTIFVFWRECGTPLCDSLKAYYATVGKYTTDGSSFSRKQVYLINRNRETDYEQAPVVIRWKGKYRFYATWYRYSPKRKNKGIAIWEGESLNEPDFKLVDTIKVNARLTVDKLFQKKIHGKTRFFPKPLKYDLWHFDLIEDNERLIMISASEKGDNIMAAISSDGVHFTTMHKPLRNNHTEEESVGYRQYFYKPTGMIQDDTLRLFFTTNDRSFEKNILVLAEIATTEI